MSKNNEVNTIDLENVTGGKNESLIQRIRKGNLPAGFDDTNVPNNITTGQGQTPGANLPR